MTCVGKCFVLRCMNETYIHRRVRYKVCMKEIKRIFIILNTFSIRADNWFIELQYLQTSRNSYERNSILGEPSNDATCQTSSLELDLATYFCGKAKQKLMQNWQECILKE